MALPEFLRVFVTFRKEEQPEWFAHIYSHGHATARVARSFAAGFDKLVRGPTLDEIAFGAQLHDIGKYLINKSILFKPGVLNEEEMATMSLHSVYGAHLLQGLPCITTHIHQIVLYHHERWDGTGYPGGLAGAAIPLSARVVAVADAYTALRARRSYKPALNRDEACSELAAMAGRELDPNLVHDFLRWALFVRGLARPKSAWPLSCQTARPII